MSFKIVEPQEFTCETNHYLIDGVKFPRVTRIKSIISNPGLVNWRLTVGRKKANEIMKVRGEFGSRAHKLIQLTLAGRDVNININDNEMRKTIELFYDFLDEHDIRVKLLEQRLWFKLTEKYKYAGTADFIGYVDGKLMLLDWKTSKAIYPDMWLQLAAYVVAFENLTNEKIDSCGILQIRDGKKNTPIVVHWNVLV
ncbi:unnamed protein product [marine sediment metagenome]|uniref:PD-(D/E)XK endonuclease-like domain-containing protein n=1 Tax=marine sediment metagenome TaxID=412755 RepID=X1KX61_9ZZZZ